MTQISKSDIHNDAAQARLVRLAGYRATQLRLERDLRQQLARQRLIALLGNHPWGWVAL